MGKSSKDEISYKISKYQDWVIILCLIIFLVDFFVQISGISNTFLLFFAHFVVPTLGILLSFILKNYLSLTWKQVKSSQTFVFVFSVGQMIMMNL